MRGSLRAANQGAGPFEWAQPLSVLAVGALLWGLGHGSAAQTVLGYVLLVVGLVVVGIPHGAVDHLLESGNWNYRHAPRFVLRYLLQAGAMALVWFWAPPLALAAFIAFSAWHFGQCDGAIWGMPSLLSMLWGAFVLLFLLGTHLAETQAILQAMGVDDYALAMPLLSAVPWILWGVFRQKWRLVLTVLQLLIASQLPLLLAFGLYFIGQHSISGWMHVKSRLKMRSVDIWRHALPFHAGAWLLLLAVYGLWLIDENLSAGGWGVFFVFLSCITLPHAISMHFSYVRNQSSRLRVDETRQ